jgi:hypothetical protein
MLVDTYKKIGFKSSLIKVPCMLNHNHLCEAYNKMCFMLIIRRMHFRFESFLIDLPHIVNQERLYYY